MRITFHELGKPPPKGERRGYVYRWRLPTSPEIGTSVLVPGLEGPVWALVIGIDDATSRERALDLKEVIRVARVDELVQARTRVDQELDAWLGMMRRAAGLPTKGRARKAVPQGYPDVPPVDGTAPPGAASTYGSAWWRAYKNARQDDEAAEFQRLARRWYAIRDAGSSP